MMYIVSGTTDLTSNFPQVLCFITEDVSQAIDVARNIPKNDKERRIQKIFIHRMEQKKEYFWSDYLPSSSKNPIMFLKTLIPGTDDWSEQFIGRGKVFNLRSIHVHDKKEQKAMPGKFRAILLHDSDAMYQIDVDTDTREEAYRLCIDATGDSRVPFQVFDDKGEPQVEKNGKLIEF